MILGKIRNQAQWSSLVRLSMYHIVRSLDVLFRSIAAVLIEDLAGRPMDVQRLHKVEHQIFHM